MSKAEEKAAEAAKPVFREFPTHPLLAFFPGPTDSEVKMLRASIKDRAVQQRVRVWQDARGDWHLIDGRTRQTAARLEFEQALAEGRPPVALNGLPLQPEAEPFVGSLDDVREFIKDANTRKNYTSGQRAAIGVGIYYHEYKMAHGDKLPDIMQEMQEEGSATAEELSVRYDTNVWYVVICRQLYREAPDLYESVCMGVTSPVKAMDQLKERRGASAPTAPGDDASDETPTAEVIKDESGAVVPDDVVEAFRSVAAFDTIKKTLRDCRSEAQKLSSEPGGEHLDYDVLEKQFNALLGHMTAAAPYLICTKCKAKGRTGGHGCKRCSETGYVTRAVVKAEEKAAKEAEKAAAAEKSKSAKPKEKEEVAAKG